VTLFAEAVRPSDKVADRRISIELDLNDENTAPGFVADDAVRVTAVQIGWIDEIPDYTLAENKDSDNFFLRQNDDADKVDIFYRILPEGVPAENVEIEVFAEVQQEPLLVLEGEKNGQGTFKTGDGLHVAWTTVKDEEGKFRPFGFYRLKLKATFGTGEAPIVCMTPVNDADAHMAEDDEEKIPGWQTPQRGLSVQDLVWKHRPILHVHEDEDGQGNDRVAGFPTTVERFIQESGDDIDRFDDDCNIVEGPAPGQRVAADTQSFYDLLQDEQATTGDLDDFTQAQRNNVLSSAPGTETIHHSAVRDDEEAKNFTFLQYWMFMNFSRRPFGIADIPFVQFDPNVQHEGDVEHVQITIRHALPDDKDTDVDESTLKKFWLLPFAATASQHFYAQTIRWDIRDGSQADDAHRQSFVEHENQRLVIYIALGAHATYFAQDADIDVPDVDARLGTMEQYDPTPNRAFDDANSATRTEYKLLSLENSFLGTFQGRWGFFTCENPDGPTEPNGPPGPPNRFALDENNNMVVLIDEPKMLHNLTIKHANGDDQRDELTIE